MIQRPWTDVMTYGELMDRYSILLLKIAKLPSKEAIPAQEEANRLLAVIIDTPLSVTQDGYALYAINEEIWNLESDIRKGKEGVLGLYEVGRRALAIRDLNRRRVELKNEINKRFGQALERKVEHASC